MQRLDFELNGGVTSTTIKVKDADGVEQDQEVRKQNIIKGRVVINERDITIEREGDCFPAHVVAELVNGELVIAGELAVPEGERPPAQLSVGAPLPRLEIPPPPFETETDRAARERRNAEIRANNPVPDAPPPAGETEAERLAREKSEREAAYAGAQDREARAAAERAADKADAKAEEKAEEREAERAKRKR